MAKTSVKITKTNFASGLKNETDSKPVYAKKYNQLKDDYDNLETSAGTISADTIGERTSGNGVTVDGVVLKDNTVTASSGISTNTANVVRKTDLVTLTATEIVGTDAGDLGHAAGAVIVAAPGAGYTLKFVNAVLIYDYSTAAYTGGTGDDLVMRQGTTAVSSAIADADLLLATGDKIVNIDCLAAADIALTANSTLNLKSTAITQPGTAAGVIRVYVTYDVITTGL